MELKPDACRNSQAEPSLSEQSTDSVVRQCLTAEAYVVIHARSCQVSPTSDDDNSSSPALLRSSEANSAPSLASTACEPDSSTASLAEAALQAPASDHGQSEQQPLSGTDTDANGATQALPSGGDKNASPATPALSGSTPNEDNEVCGSTVSYGANCIASWKYPSIFDLTSVDKRLTPENVAELRPLPVFTTPARRRASDGET